MPISITPDTTTSTAQLAPRLACAEARDSSPVFSRKLNLKSANMPDIVELDKDQTRQALARLRENLLGWDEAAVDPSAPEKEIDQVERWNAHVSGAKAMIEVDGPHEDNYFAHRTVMHRVGGEPVGLMSFEFNESNKRVEVYNLVTHPGSERGGGVLLTHAVNESQRAGGAGRVELDGRDVASIKAYKALGFERISLPTGLGLNPAAKPEVWQKDERTQEWGLVKLAKQRSFVR